jgi:hypothetical protein
MAIQLDCPACFQTLRVPDSTMGKISVCPKCQAKMRVPRVTIPVVAAPVPSYEAETQSFITPPVPLGGDSPFFAAEEDEAPAEPINPHAVLARRNNRRMSRGWIGVILAFVAATIGISGVWWWSNRQNVERTATASVIANATLSKDLTQGETNVSSPDWGAIIASLKVNPVEPADPRMKVQFATNGNSLRLSLTPTSERMLVAVPTSAIAELQDPSLNAAFLEAWKGAISQSMTQMSKTIQEAVAGGVPPRLAAYGEVVGVEALAGPRGYHFTAAIGTTGYPCVFEDANHQLYFLVPTGTQSLAVVPREIGARNSLPAKLWITATVK